MFPRNGHEFIQKFLKSHRFYLGIMVLVFIYVGLHTTIYPYVLKIFIDKAMKAFNQDHFFQSCLLPASLLVFLNLVLNAAWRINNYVSLKSIPLIKTDILNETSDYIRRKPYPFFQENFGGTISSKIASLANNTESMINNSRELLRQSIAIISSVLISCLVHPYFLILFLLWSGIFIAISFSVCKNIQPYVKNYSESYSRSFGKIVDSFTNALSVLIFAREDYEKRLLQDSLKDMSQKDRVLQWRFLRFGLIMSGMAFLIQVFSIGLLLSFGAKGLLSPGDFAFIFIVANNLMYQVWFFTETLVKFSEQYGSFKHALEFLTQTPTEPKNQNIPLSIQNIIPNIQVSKGEIVFQEVNFAFSSQEKIFNQKSLIIPGGQKVGIVGYSGSGKSTFVNLITRLLDINHQQGKILIDNQTIHEASLKSLRENIAFIPQDQVLFHRSILENIRYSKLEAPEEEIIHAAQKAHAHDFIMKLPQQYHTLVGERGIKLSGGQKQRIAIARAILKDSPILILDEATSALDSITESLIQKSLNSLMQNKTVIVIAHRLSTIMNLDRILVFHNGMIVEDGTHQELLENNRLYTHLWTMQEK